MGNRPCIDAINNADFHSKLLNYLRVNPPRVLPAFASQEGIVVTAGDLDVINKAAGRPVDLDGSPQTSQKQKMGHQV
jgi:hypothetical protein